MGSLCSYTAFRLFECMHGGVFASFFLLEEYSALLVYLFKGLFKKESMMCLKCEEIKFMGAFLLYVKIF